MRSIANKLSERWMRWTCTRTWCGDAELIQRVHLNSMFSLERTFPKCPSCLSQMVIDRSFKRD